MRSRMGWIVVIGSVLLLLSSPRLRERLFSLGKELGGWINRTTKGKSFFFRSGDLNRLIDESIVQIYDDRSKDSLVFNSGD